MNHDSYSDNYIRGILNTVKTIAMVGASEKENRPSYFAFKYLLERGYRMIPVNPGQAGKDCSASASMRRLADVPGADRHGRHLPQLATCAADRGGGARAQPRPQVIWMQLGVRNDEAAALAEANGMKVVMNRCPKIEYGRLSSEIAWMGVNTRTISARKVAARGIQRMSLDRISTRGGTTEAATAAERIQQETARPDSAGTFRTPRRLFSDQLKKPFGV